MDKGHEKLIGDLTTLLSKAAIFEFHDFKNTSYATPKVELYKQLMELADNVKSGEYDNEYNGEKI